LQIITNKISVIRGKKNHHVVLLTKEATHYVSPFNEKKKSHRFYGCHGLKQVKILDIRVIRVIRGRKTFPLSC
jgi:hypothetical protein